MSTIDLKSATPEQIAAAPPAQFLRTIKAMSDKDLQQVMESDNRDVIVEAMFEGMPDLFDPERSGSVQAVSHWSITNGDGPNDDWTVSFADGVCAVARGHDGEPQVSLTMSPESFAKVASKSGNPVTMFMMGKIKATGDLALAANIASFFSVPEA